MVKLSGLDKGGDAEFNEHVFYSYPTMVKLVADLADRLGSLDSADKATFTANAKTLTAKLEDLESQTAAVKKTDQGDKVAYTEPVPGYLFDAMGLDNVTPEAFSEAIEEGDDVPPAALNDTLKLFSGGTVEAARLQRADLEPGDRTGQEGRRPGGHPRRRCHGDAPEGGGLRLVAAGEHRRGDGGTGEVTAVQDQTRTAAAPRSGGPAVLALRDAGLAYGDAHDSGTASTSTSRRASSSRCSGRTARARPRC